jgi:hypothetical protein
MRASVARTASAAAAAAAAAAARSLHVCRLDWISRVRFLIRACHGVSWSVLFFGSTDTQRRWSQAKSYAFIWALTWRLVHGSSLACRGRRLLLCVLLLRLRLLLKLPTKTRRRSPRTLPIVSPTPACWLLHLLAPHHRARREQAPARASRLRCRLKPPAAARQRPREPVLDCRGCVRIGDAFSGSVRVRADWTTGACLLSSELRAGRRWRAFFILHSFASYYHGNNNLAASPKFSWPRLIGFTQPWLCSTALTLRNTHRRITGLHRHDFAGARRVNRSSF